jgi:hypothetical protein
MGSAVWLGGRDENPSGGGGSGVLGGLTVGPTEVDCELLFEKSRRFNLDDNTVEYAGSLAFGPGNLCTFSPTIATI